MALTYDTLQNDTIAAIATGITESGIGIIRISGPDAFAVGDRLCRGRDGSHVFSSWKPGTIHFCLITDPDKEGGKEPCVIDEAMVSVMRAPHSYTTEDTVEINIHGGVYLMNRVLELALHNGCRMAEPGEFTKRAFLGGRIDLSRAEAVMDLIQSDNEFSRRTAVEQLEGSVSTEVKKLREEILYEIAFIESALDDPENYSMEGYPEKLRKKCSDLIDRLDHLLQFSESGRVLKEGIRTVIVGKPNAGKSSLMNFLAGSDRAIVTDVAGTTRDTLEEKIRLGDVILDVTDTAGIRKTDDVVEKIGVERAQKAAKQADLILYLVDTSTGISEEDRYIFRLLRERISAGTRCIILLNKTDLPSRTDRNDIAEMFRFIAPSPKPEGSTRVVNYKRAEVIPVSIRTGEGMEDFKAKIQQMFRTGEIASKNEVFLSSLRQRTEARSARDSLKLVVNSIDSGMSEDFFSIDLMNAYTALGRIIGEAVEDDLVEEIFSKFCLGK